LILNEELDLQLILNELFMSIEDKYLLLKASQFESLKTDYLSRLYWLNEEHIFCSSDLFKGRITGIDELGRLKVETLEGTRLFNFKEVEFIE
jgi:BirA family transcriptional regulator, biotin operon repressor / biotin---[acetyl-CoA-carboxylase] ligase